MRICILDGHPDKLSETYSRTLRELTDGLISRGHSVDLLTLRELDIRYCTGCWSCWWATPGECAFKDESHTVCREYINSDFVLFVSPLKMGFVSTLVKKTQDKLIPLIHPYIKLIGGECHHHKRYDSYPKLGLLLYANTPRDSEDFDITAAMFRRFAINLHSDFAFTKLIDDSTEDIVHAIDNL